jgi:hypothetical protein
LGCLLAALKSQTSEAFEILKGEVMETFGTLF